jgi:tRNA A37 threonylcarbamoyladenosine biosynthesis protein TsaE
VESEAYSIVEWSERVPEYIPEDAITVTISRVAEDESLRDIEIVGGVI